MVPGMLSYIPFAMATRLYAVGSAMVVNEALTLSVAFLRLIAEAMNPRRWVTVAKYVAAPKTRRIGARSIVVLTLIAAVVAGAPLLQSRVGAQDDALALRRQALEFVRVESEGLIPDIEPFMVKSAEQRDRAASARFHYFAPVHFENAQRFMRDQDCMSRAIYYEAGIEAISGKLAVAEVILNRVRHNLYPNNVCDVIYDGSERKSGCQFSFTCDGAEAREPRGRNWADSQAVARNALLRLSPPVTDGATHYHADYVSPYWAPRLVRTETIGAHIFYRYPSSREGTA